MNQQLFTFGYAGKEPSQLLTLAEEHENALVVDVRLKPWTKQEGWSMKELRAFLPRYTWIQDFGNEAYDQDFVQLKDPAAGLRKLREKTGPWILLCACWSWSQCHRKHVAEYVARELGIETVTHLTAPSVRKPPNPDQLFLF